MTSKGGMNQHKKRLEKKKNTEEKSIFHEIKIIFKEIALWSGEKQELAIQVKRCLAKQKNTKSYWGPFFILGEQMKKASPDCQFVIELLLRMLCALVALYPASHARRRTIVIRSAASTLWASLLSFCNKLKISMRILFRF